MGESERGTGWPARKTFKMCFKSTFPFPDERLSCEGRLKTVEVGARYTCTPILCCRLSTLCSFVGWVASSKEYPIYLGQYALLGQYVFDYRTTIIYLTIYKEKT